MEYTLNINFKKGLKGSVDIVNAFKPMPRMGEEVIINGFKDGDKTFIVSAIKTFYDHNIGNVYYCKTEITINER